MSQPEILYLIPGRAPGDAERQRRQDVADDRVPAPVTVEWVDNGPAGVAASIEETWSASGLFSAAAERESSYDALVIGCFGDPGLRGLRELLSIPVVGPAEATVHTAVQLADSYGWITPLDRTVTMARSRAHELRSSEALIGVYSLDLDPAELGREAVLSQAFSAVGKKAAADGANTLVPGCMSLAFAQRHEEVASELPVPLLDPLALSLEQAATWARTGTIHSRRTYPEADRDRLETLLE